MYIITVVYVTHAPSIDHQTIYRSLGRFNKTKILCTNYIIYLNNLPVLVIYYRKYNIINLFVAYFKVLQPHYTEF